MGKAIILVCLLACCAGALANNNAVIQCLEPPRALQIWYKEERRTVYYENIQMSIIYDRDNVTTPNGNDFFIQDSRILLSDIAEVTPRKYRLPSVPLIISTNIRWSKLPNDRCSVSVINDENPGYKFSKPYIIRSQLEEKLLWETGRCLKFLCTQV